MRATVCRLLAAVAVALGPQPVGAQTLSGFSANQIHAQTRSADFVSLEPAFPMAQTASLGVRLSYLGAPVRFALAAPSPTATETPAVNNLLLVEAMLAVRPFENADVGLSLPWHALQAGYGNTEVAQGGEYYQSALGDPHLTVGYSIGTDVFRVRPLASLFFPLGSPSSWSGEGAFHGEAGAAAALRLAPVELSLDVRFVLREPRTVSLISLQHQLRIAFGARYFQTRKFYLAAEGVVAPILGAQPPVPDGVAAVFVPAEAIASGGVEPGPFHLSAGVGLGLPFSRTSSITGSTATVAAGTPAMRAFVDARLLF
jgi:hypothetical protein